MGKRCLPLTPVAVLGMPLAGLSQQKAGPEFLVNTYTTERQEAQSVASDQTCGTTEATEMATAPLYSANASRCLRRCNKIARSSAS